MIEHKVGQIHDKPTGAFVSILYSGMFGEATWSKNSKCKFLTFRALFS